MILKGYICLLFIYLFYCTVGELHDVESWEWYVRLYALGIVICLNLLVAQLDVADAGSCAF